jgi:hypothetical protein
MPFNDPYPPYCSNFQGRGAANGDNGSDTEVNTLAHELAEANTDRS